MGKFRKKPVVIEAYKLSTGSHEFISDWMLANGIEYTRREIFGMSIPTLEGVMSANWGDWIIKGVNGEFYPCKPDIFEKTYERAE